MRGELLLQMPNSWLSCPVARGFVKRLAEPQAKYAHCVSSVVRGHRTCKIDCNRARLAAVQHNAKYVRQEICL